MEITPDNSLDDFDLSNNQKPVPIVPIQVLVPGKSSKWRRQQLFSSLPFEDQIVYIKVYLQMQLYPFKDISYNKKLEFRRITHAYSLFGEQVHKCIKYYSRHYKKKMGKHHFFLINGKPKNQLQETPPSQEQSCKSTFFSEKDVICIPDPGDQKKLLDTVHSHPGKGYSGHLGVNRMMKNLSERYYWPHMGEDVREFCRICDHCQHVNQVSLQVKMGTLVNSNPRFSLGTDWHRSTPVVSFSGVQLCSYCVWLLLQVGGAHSTSLQKCTWGCRSNLHPTHL